MNYAVLTYKYADNPKNIPESWVAEVIPLIKRIKNSSPPEGTPISEIVNWPEFVDVPVSFPEGEGWVLMTDVELSLYKESCLSEYLIWQSANEEPAPTSSSMVTDGSLLIATTTDNGVDKLQVARGASVNFPIMEVFDDFMWTTLGSGTNPNSCVTNSSNGGSAAVETTVTSNEYLGRISVSTGTTSNSSGVGALDFWNKANKLRLGRSRGFFEVRVMIPVLSTATVAFTAYAGIKDGAAQGFPTNGIYFSYSHSGNSGCWVANCTSASSTSSVNSSVPVVVNKWYKLRGEINAARTLVEFFVDDISIGTKALCIPAATIGMRPVFKIEKNSLTTTSSVMWADYLYLKFFR